MKNSRNYSRSPRVKGQQLNAAEPQEENTSQGAVSRGQRGPVPSIKDTDSTLQAIIRGSMFWSPAHLGDAWNEYIPFAFWLVDVLRPRLIVEVGSVSPVSYLAFCQAVIRNQSDAQCVAIDTGEGTASDQKCDYLKLQNDRHYSAFSSITTAKSDEWIKLLTPGSVDLLHLNFSTISDHGIEELLVGYLALMSHKGVLLLSGTGIQAKQASVRNALSVLRSKYSTFEFVQGNGLAVVGIGKSVSRTPLGFLLSPESSGSLQAIRDVFSRLGQTCVDAYTANHGEGKNSRVTAEFESTVLKLRDELTYAREEASRGLHQIADLKHEKSALSKKLEELDKSAKTSFAAQKKQSEQKEAALKSEIEEIRKRAALVEVELLSARKLAAECSKKNEVLETVMKRMEIKEQRQLQEVVALSQILLDAEAKLDKLRAEFIQIAVASKSQNSSSLTANKKQGLLPSIFKSLGGNSRGQQTGDEAKFLQAQKLLSDSALFDGNWYSRRYPDVLNSNMTPIEHYLTIGATLGYDPSASFNSSYYLDKYKDVASSGMNPLVHYLRFGVNENRQPKA